MLTDVLAKFNPTHHRHANGRAGRRAAEIARLSEARGERGCGPKGMSASVRAHLAVLLAQVGGPRDIPDLRRLIEADSIRYREMQAARAKGDRSGDNVSLRASLHERGNGRRSGAWGRSLAGNAE